MNNKIVGVIPARMSASRFPGKPLYPILGRPMLEHVYCRSRMYEQWDKLVIATCDEEIEGFAKSHDAPVVITGTHHKRALDRVTEAITLLDETVSETDIVVCVQGDEPMLQPGMINAVVDPLLLDPMMPCTLLAIHITEKELWVNPDIVKVVHSDAGEVLYTSRAPIPYCKEEFSSDLMARRVGGIFAFRWKYLKIFSEYPATRLEQLESCDSNRILDMPFVQYIGNYPDVRTFSVDSPSDIELVEKFMVTDRYWGQY